jgi:hypothetical protein
LSGHAQAAHFFIESDSQAPNGDLRLGSVLGLEIDLPMRLVEVVGDVGGVPAQEEDGADTVGGEKGDFVHDGPRWVGVFPRV